MSATEPQAEGKRSPRAGERSGQPLGDDLLAAAPGIARIAASAWWRTTGWTLDASVRVGSRVVRAAISGESPADLLRDARSELRGLARTILGVEDGDGAVPRQPPGSPPASSRNGAGPSLRERGAELLRRSADVRVDEEGHPAYDLILEQLAPDEGRILRLLALEGPQPAVDVRAGLIPLDAATELIAPGLNMIGAEAGCRHVERVPAYLNNLYRLGLVWFSREQVHHRLRYQVLEAQPEVVEAMRRAGRTGRTVRRSIHLTPFGGDFCETCLPLGTGELDALPGRPERPAPDEAPAE